MENQNNIKAIILVLFGMSVFALQDTFIKLLSTSTNLYLIYLIRSLIGLTVIISFIKYKKKYIIFKTHYPILTFVRVSAFFFGFSLYLFL